MSSASFCLFCNHLKFFLEYKNFYKLGARKFYLPKYKTFFFYFSNSESYFLVYEKGFLFFNIRATKLLFAKYNKI